MELGDFNTSKKKFLKKITLMTILFGRGELKMSKNTFVSVKEVEDVYKDYFKEVGIKFSKHNFEKFLKFLQIDFNDWVKGNLRYFDQR